MLAFGGIFRRAGGKLDSGDAEEAWTEVSPRRRASSDSPRSPGRLSLTGQWKTQDGELVAEISGDAIHWPDGSPGRRTKLSKLPDGRLSMELDGVTYYGGLDDSSAKITWDDGEVWVCREREALSRSPRETVRPQASAAGQNATPLVLPIESHRDRPPSLAASHLETMPESSSMPGGPSTPPWLRRFNTRRTSDPTRSPQRPRGAPQLTALPRRCLVADGSSALAKQISPPSDSSPSPRSGSMSPVPHVFCMGSPVPLLSKPSNGMRKRLGAVIMDDEGGALDENLPSDPDASRSPSPMRRKRLGGLLPPNDLDRVNDGLMSRQDSGDSITCPGSRTGRRKRLGVLVPKKTEPDDEAACNDPVSIQLPPRWEIESPKMQKRIASWNNMASFQDGVPAPPADRGKDPAGNDSLFDFDLLEIVEPVSPKRRPRVADRPFSPSGRLGAQHKVSLSSDRAPEGEGKLDSFMFQVQWVVSDTVSKVVDELIECCQSVPVPPEDPEADHNVLVLDVLEQALEAIFRPKEAYHFTQLLATGGSQHVVKQSGSINRALSAALFGLARAARMELLSLGQEDAHIIALDHPPGLVGAAGAVIPRSLGVDKLAGLGEFEIAVRDRSAYVPRVHAVPSSTSNSMTLNLQSHSGPFVMSGGKGALGCVVSKLLAQSGAEEIVVFSRSAARTSFTWPKASTTVRTAPCDVSSITQLRACVQNLELTNTTPACVFHLAGVLADDMATKMDREQLEKVWRPKVLGAVRMHTVFKKSPSFVLFSSVVSAFGNAGQVNLAAASAAMDALAHLWNQDQGANVCSLQWGPWAEVGMSSRIKGGGHKKFEQKGIGGVSNEMGIKALCFAVSNPKVPSVMTIAPILWPKFCKWYGRAHPNYYKELKSKGQAGMPKPMIPIGKPRSSQVRSKSASRTDQKYLPRILMLVNGTRGDIQPVLALSKFLLRSGYVVQILTNADLVELAHKFDVDARAVYPDCAEVIRRTGGMGGTSFLDGAMKARKAAQAWLEENPGVCEPVDDAVEDFNPDLIMYSAQSSGPAIKHEVDHGVPSVPMFFFRQALELFEAILYSEPARPSLLATSQYLDGHELPDCKTLSQTGVWVLQDQPSEADCSRTGRYAELLKFLAAGSKPVVITWGSMLAEGVSRESMLTLALETIEITGERGIILGGTAQLEKMAQENERGRKAKNCCFVSDVPHAWLFPQCRCVVHHGGAGTTHAVLLAGVPQVITPVYMDQFELADAVNDLALGIGFDKGLDSIDASELAAAIDSASADFTQTLAISQMSVEAEANTSVQKAADIVSKFLTNEVLTGKWRKAWQIVRTTCRQKFPGAN